MAMRSLLGVHVFGVSKIYGKKSVNRKLLALILGMISLLLVQFEPISRKFYRHFSINMITPNMEWRS